MERNGKTILLLRTERNDTRKKEQEWNDLAEGPCSRMEWNDLKKIWNEPSPRWQRLNNHGSL